MSAGGALFFLLALALCSAVIIAPLSSGLRRRRRSRRSDQRREALLLQYERVLLTLRDLDEDQLTGKVDSAGHAQEREIWLRRGAALLAELDALAQEPRP